ncbi:MAG: ThaI family type II restriction endonuclease [Theionarchaea archaeon]|nr:ThaI family type II restriction endonuclease [Theionarchaea archaeon]
MVKDRMSKVIEIYWEKTKVDYSPYKRWIDYWREG